MKTLVSILVVTALAIPITSLAADQNTPSPIKAFEKQGLKMAGHFKEANGLTGYGSSYQGQPVAIYLTPDHQHAIVGTMGESQGKNFSAASKQRLVTHQQHQKVWLKLKKATWVADGSANAKRVVYVFTDPNCPYCHKFWQEARPWVNADKVEIRHVIVGILEPSSMPKAAAILSASNPSAALSKDEHQYSQGGLAPMQNPPADLIKKVEANNQLMKSLGVSATPTIYYHDASGKVKVIKGVPRGKTMIAVMGNSRP